MLTLFGSGHLWPKLGQNVAATCRRSASLRRVPRHPHGLLYCFDHGIRLIDLNVMRGMRGDVAAGFVSAARAWPSATMSSKALPVFRYILFKACLPSMAWTGVPGRNFIDWREHKEVQSHKGKNGLRFGNLARKHGPEPACCRLLSNRIEPVRRVGEGSHRAAWPGGMA